MRIEVDRISKRYHKWVLRDFSATFDGPGIYGICGRNGSGKSTLIKIISGYLTPTKGRVRYFHDDGSEQMEIHKLLSFTAPYIQPIEELTLSEHLAFHRAYRPLTGNLSEDAFFDRIELTSAKQQTSASLSSGMRQRFQLGLALLSIAEIYLLDEPYSFLDAQARTWFDSLLQNEVQNKVVIIASNREEVIKNCKQNVEVPSLD